MEMAVAADSHPFVGVGRWFAEALQGTSHGTPLGSRSPHPVGGWAMADQTIARCGNTGEHQKLQLSGAEQEGAARPPSDDTRPCPLHTLVLRRIAGRSPWRCVGLPPEMTRHGRQIPEPIECPAVMISQNLQL